MGNKPTPPADFTNAAYIEATRDQRRFNDMTTSPMTKAGEQPTITQALEPCPFCQMPVQHRFALHVSDGNTDDIIHAAPTDCGLQYFSVGSADQGVTVAKAWNARANQPPAQDGLVDALELAFDFAVKVNALLTPLKSEWQAVNMWTEYDEGVYQMRPKVTMALQAALSAIKGDKS